MHDFTSNSVIKTVRGSAKFQNIGRKLEIIHEAQKNVDTELETYKLRRTKPPMIYYGSYGEILQQLCTTTKKKIKTKKTSHKEQFSEKLKVVPVDFSYMETGQMVAKADFDDEKIDLTPDS